MNEIKYDAYQKTPGNTGRKKKVDMPALSVCQYGPAVICNKFSCFYFLNNKQNTGCPKRLRT